MCIFAGVAICLPLSLAEKRGMENSKILRFTEKEMIEEWKLRKRLVGGERECSVERDDAVDVDAILLREINAWYERLLAEAPVECLPVRDIAQEVEMTVGADCVAEIRLPDCCVRPLSLKLPGWSAAVSRFVTPTSAEAERQRHPFLRRGVQRPVCVGERGRITAYCTLPSAVRPELLEAVCRPSAGSYELTERAWSVFPEYFPPA